MTSSRTAGDTPGENVPFTPFMRASQSAPRRRVKSICRVSGGRLAWSFSRREAQPDPGSWVGATPGAEDFTMGAGMESPACSKPPGVVNCACAGAITRDGKGGIDWVGKGGSVFGGGSVWARESNRNRAIGATRATKPARNRPDIKVDRMSFPARSEMGPGGRPSMVYRTQSACTQANRRNPAKTSWIPPV